MVGVGVGVVAPTRARTRWQPEAASKAAIGTAISNTRLLEQLITLFTYGLAVTMPRSGVSGCVIGTALRDLAIRSNVR